jgi:eukaryotic-like serine/threonine-protein kinase
MAQPERPGASPEVSTSSTHLGELAARFELGQHLGAGAFGAVYEAYDRTREVRVALKELQSLDAGAIYAFKQEFRALADVTHENLVGLHELLSVGDRWFLTMDLVLGQSFVDHVRRALRPASTLSTDPTLGAAPPLAGEPEETIALSRVCRVHPRSIAAYQATMLQGAPPPAVAPARSAAVSAAPADRALDVDRLRAALAGLARGVSALHAAGRLHRDLKPSNVLVTGAGRVVILDFGLVAYLAHAGGDQGGEKQIVGTPAYMSPEQARGAALTPASDWYAVGAMLYEALTGTLPFMGGIAEILYVKQVVDPRHPRELCPDVPEDLAALSMQLLDRSCEKRPGGAEIARALGAAPEAATSASAPASRRRLDQQPPFVGRAHQLAALADAFAATMAGSPVIVHVHGTSGMGKSDLVRRFLGELTQRASRVLERGTSLVLEGRCHERESVPYKALDSVIDGLTRHLLQLPADQLVGLLPCDMLALARLFPVLGRAELLIASAHAGAVDARGAAPDSAPDSTPDRAPGLAPEPHELRRRAFAALRELLTRIARRRPLILYIDALQWGDSDSAALLVDLLRPPGAPALLLLASYRSEDAQTSEVIRNLPRPALPHAGPFRELAGVEVREVVLGPLDHGDARELARQLLDRPPADAAALERDLDMIARESGGSPFFVQELAQFAAHSRIQGGISLGRLLIDRICKLPETPRRMLEVLAVAGRPLEHAVMRQAAAVSGGEEHAGLALLRAGNLVRSRTAGGGSGVETYHDRVREGVVASLSPGVLAERHLAVARALEATGRADPETLLVHFRGGGDIERARRYAERAAERAAHALAFDRAASLCRVALELAGHRASPELHLKLADALANAGRGAEAARAYLVAAALAPPSEAFSARRRAAEQLLRSGHVDEGLAAVRVLLPLVRMELTKTPARSLASLLASRLKLKVRGLGFRERPERAIRADELRRIDVCWSLGNGLGGVDPIRGADFQARHLLLALEAGEPYRIARALAWEAVYASMEGKKASLARATRLIAKSSEIAHRIQHPHAVAWVTAAEAIASSCAHAWRKAAELSERAIALFREACSEVAWEVSSMQAWWLMPALVFGGEIAEVTRRAPIYLKEAEELGDLYCATTLRTYVTPWSWMAADQPRDALRDIEDAMRRWSKDGVHLQHWAALLSRCQTYLYEGDGARALSLFQAQLKVFERAFVARSDRAQLQAVNLRARCALAAARHGRDRASLLRLAERDAQELERDGRAWPLACALSIQAGIAAIQRRPDKAAELYAQAATRFGANGMELHAAAARRLLGGTMGGAGGRTLVKAADMWMAQQGIKSPERMTAMLFPS